MSNLIANFIRSLRRDLSQNVDERDRNSVSPPIAEREGIASGPAHPPELANPGGLRRKVVVFVPDITQSSSATWKTDASEFWPNERLRGFHKVTFDYVSKFATSIDKLLSYDIIRMIALRLLSEMQKELQKIKRENADVDSLVIIAHGYGGLISEQAYLFSLMPDWPGLVKIQGLILFGTPHFLAGLAQWALISAKKLGLACEDSPQQKDWSEKPLEKDLQCIAEMQKEFRDLDDGLKMACYFSLLPDPQSKLEISPQWAILPGVKAVALNNHHFGMTKVHEPNAQQIDELPNRISREALERRWIISSPAHDRTPTQVSTERPSVKKDKIFSPRLDGEQEVSGQKETNISQPRHPTLSAMDSPDDPTLSTHGFTGLFVQLHGEAMMGRCNRLGEMIWKTGLINDITRLEYGGMLDRDLTHAMLDFALTFQFPSALEILRVLFVLRGDDITISNRHLECVATDESRSGKAAEILELILLLRGDQVLASGLENTFEAAARDNTNGIAVIQVLLDRFAEQMSAAAIANALRAAATIEGSGADTMQALLNEFGDRVSATDLSGILKAAAANQTNGASILPSLLKRADLVAVPHIDNVFKIAAANPTHSAVLIQTLLDRYGDGEIPLSTIQDVVTTAASNEQSGAGAIELVLNRYEDSIELTETLSEAAASNSSLKMRLKTSLILLRAATKKSSDSSNYTRRLLQTGSPCGPLDERFSWKMLSFAADAYDIGVCRLLLDSGIVDEDFRDYENGQWTPLLYAIYKEGDFKDKNVIKVLVDTEHIDKDDVEAVRKDEKALSYAARLGLGDAIGHLVRIDGIRLDSADQWDQTPLFFAAASEGSQRVVDILLDAYNDGKHEDDKFRDFVNARNYKGETALFWAVRAGKEEAVESLLKKGKADVNIVNRDGETPYSLAKLGNHFRIMDLLLQEGALDTTGR